jgi:uncharacterized protein (DUF58 family)
MTNSQTYLDPKVLNKISRLDLKARLIVEGYISGLHKSPYHGFSIEFAQHREYVPGDDIRHIDWKVYGRSDRYYIKQYEEETNLICNIILDCSESMSYASGPVSKFEYGSYIACSLAYLILNQRDSVGLSLFDDSVVEYLGASNNPNTIKQMVHLLEKTSVKRKTNMERVFHDIAERFKRRGLVIVISDCFEDPQNLLNGIRHFRHRRHDVILFHLLDHYELTFPFQKMTLFEGLEGFPEVLTNPQALRNAYISHLNTFVHTLRKGCLRDKIDYVQLDTDQTLDVALSTYLATRAGGGGG